MAEEHLPNQGILLLYWDYELQRGADRSRSGPKEWGIEDYRQTKRLLDLLDEYEVKATFAIVGHAALNGELPYHAPDQIREIADRGHEVASHSWGHEWIPDLTYDELKQMLKHSKEQLEEVTGRAVLSFAPPWNVPSKYLRKGAVSLYQWRRSRYNRIDIPTLCRALREVGYKTSRIAYEPIHYNLSRHLLRRIIRKPTRAQWIEGVLCFQVNGGGFAGASLKIVRQAADTDGFAVIFAHPHSLIADNSQNIKYFTGFLETMDTLREQGKLVVTTPAEVYRDWQTPSV